MIDLVRTGVFATKDELDDLRHGSEQAAKTPVISLTGESKDDWALNARKNLQQVCHKVALSHDLPEISGYYGIDLETGEFVRYE